MAFLPQGSIPYQQYVNGERPSLASYLRSRSGMRRWRPIPIMRPAGTVTRSIRGWDLLRVFLKIRHYGARFVRDYVSDASCADKIIQLYEQKEEGRPLFVFNVTMQNHGGYDQSCTNHRVFGGVNSISVSQYFSLIKLSDQALSS